MSDEKYVPPSSALTLKQILEEPVDHVTPVNCANCPINMMCQESTGGTGYVCDECRATSVYVTDPDDEGLVDDILVVDCNKHRFPKNDEKSSQCGLCDGGITRFYAENYGAVHHYLPTVHASVPLQKRKEALQAGFVYWTNFIAKQKAEKAARLAAKKARLAELVLTEVAERDAKEEEEKETPNVSP